MKVPFLDLKKINSRHEEQFIRAFKEVSENGYYIKGKFLEKFEAEFASYCGSDYCIGTGNGLDALSLILMAYKELGKINPSDEVIVPSNTFIASVLSVVNNDLIPVLVEPNPSTFNLDPSLVEDKISPKTKVVMAVHLYGQLAEMNRLRELCNRHNLILIEDAAQAHGATDGNGRRAGSLGDAAAFSFYPAKNLGALGDGGAVTTNNQVLAEMVRKLGNYGSDKKYDHELAGVNSRLDEIQAAWLSIKLKSLDSDNVRRREIAMRYHKEIENNKVIKPLISGKLDHVFHLYVLRVGQRDKFQAYLKGKEIETGIHYPISLSSQPALSGQTLPSLPIAEQLSSEVLSLPISPVMTDAEVQSVIDAVNAY